MCVVPPIYIAALDLSLAGCRSNGQIMTLETARAILGISTAHQTWNRLVPHSIAELAAFELRLARLRPRKFVRLPPRAGTAVEHPEMPP